MSKFKNITVYSPKEKRISQAPMKKHLWYDSVHKKLITIEAQDLVYEYKMDTTMNPPSYRLMPNGINKTAATVEVQSDTVKIRKWFREYTNYNNTDSEMISETKASVTFSVPEKEVDDFVYDLERRGFFRYEVD